MVIIVPVFGVSRCVLFVVTTRLGEDLEPSKERIGIKAIDEIVKCAVLKEKSVVTPMKNQLTSNGFHSLPSSLIPRETRLRDLNYS
jgi:hypothetical protein